MLEHLPKNRTPRCSQAAPFDPLRRGSFRGLDGIALAVSELPKSVDRKMKGDEPAGLFQDQGLE
jgi:hypothetical protein